MRQPWIRSWEEFATGPHRASAQRHPDAAEVLLRGQLLERRRSVRRHLAASLRLDLRPGLKLTGDALAPPVRGFRAHVELSGPLDRRLSLGNAVLGGLAFGPTGAVVGAFAGKRSVYLVLTPPGADEETYAVDPSDENDARVLAERKRRRREGLRGAQAAPLLREPRLNHLRATGELTAMTGTETQRTCRLSVLMGSAPPPGRTTGARHGPEIVSIIAPVPAR